jgi:8-oxo-dGTP pyrophosphatase MutT (NUDIX family)
MERLQERTVSVETTIHNRTVRVLNGLWVTQEDLNCAIGCQIFRDWIISLDPRIPVEEVLIQGIYYRAKAPDVNKVLFVMLVAKIAGVSTNYCIVLRGATVAFLPVFVCEGEEYTVLTRQRRPAVGDRFATELPAGMTDGQGGIKSVALKEIEEELQITVAQHELILMYDQSLEPSMGLIQEPMFFYYFRRELTMEQLREFEGKHTGAANENEEIILQVCRLDEIRMSASRDIKAWLAYYMYRERFPLIQQQLVVQTKRKKLFGIF